MPTFFRPPRPSRRVVGGRKVFIPGPILTAVGTAEGVATVTGVGLAIVTAAGSTAGAATVSGVGAGVIAAAGSAAGAATVAGTGASFFVAAGVAAGSASAEAVATLRQITSTLILQKPVNCVMAGEQIKYRAKLSGRALRHAFGE